MTSISHLLSLISKCRYEENDDVDRQIDLLDQINSALPKTLRIDLPSLITNDYIGKALDIIEKRIIKMSIATLSNNTGKSYEPSSNIGEKF